MSKPTLLWTWPEALEEIDGLRTILDSFAELDMRALDSRELSEAVTRCEILVPHLSHNVGPGVLDAAARLRIIGTPSTGTDHIAMDEAKRRGIEVVSLKGDREFLDTLQSTAELAWLLILACSRNLRSAFRQVEAGQWNSQAIRGHELIDHTIGIIGYGRLGSMVSRFAHAFRMKVIATDPQGICDSWVKQVSLDELLSRADVVTIHVHLDEQTRGMIGRQQIFSMKPGAILINTSRGGLIDEGALLEALRSGHLAAAGLDVIQAERAPDLANSPLLRYAAEHENLLITPHVGGVTVEAQAKAFRHFALKLRDVWYRIAHAEPRVQPKT